LWTISKHEAETQKGNDSTITYKIEEMTILWDYYKNKENIVSMEYLLHLLLFLFIIRPNSGKTACGEKLRTLSIGETEF
jgi:hypothetical protein